MIYLTHFEKNRNKYSKSITPKHKRLEIVKTIDKKLHFESYPSIENRLSNLTI